MKVYVVSEISVEPEVEAVFSNEELAKDFVERSEYLSSDGKRYRAYSYEEMEVDEFANCNFAFQVILNKSESYIHAEIYSPSVMSVLNYTVDIYKSLSGIEIIRIFLIAHTVDDAIDNAKKLKKEIIESGKWKVGSKWTI